MADATTAARLDALPSLMTSSMKSTRSSASRTVNCLLIPLWYQNGMRREAPALDTSRSVGTGQTQRPRGA